MSHNEKVQKRIDAYLMELRRCLGELPEGEVGDILREIRGHILERAEASGELTEERLVGILKALGRPEDIAPLYKADSLMARARSSLSPTTVLRAALRWAMLSIEGFFIFLVGLIGYALALAFLAAGIGKMIAPHSVGAWVYPGGFSLGTNNNPEAREVLGYWLIPVGLTLDAALTVGTTRLLRWALRFAKVRRPPLDASRPASLGI